MVASLVLAIMVVGSAAYMYQSRAGVYNEADRRVALEVANSRLELIRVSAYADIRPASGGRWFLSRNGANWELDRTDQHEMVTINGREYRICTTVRIRSGNNPDMEYLAIMVRVGFGDSFGGAFVRLDTNVAE